MIRYDMVHYIMSLIYFLSCEDIFILLVNSFLVQFSLIWFNESKEMRRSVSLVIELLRIAWNKTILNITQHSHSDEVVVPDMVSWNHKEPKEIVC